MGEDDKDGLSKNSPIDSSYKKDEQGSKDHALNKKSSTVSDDNVFIVKKPEKTNLFKKLFSENNNKKSSSLKKSETSNVAALALSNENKDKISKTTLKTNLANPKIEDKLQKDLPPIVRNERPLKKGHKRLDDVKFVPKVMGPLEELQYLDVLNFRRLGASPQERTTKIFNKVKLLEKEGYGKMIEAITAWKKSPVNRLYLRNIQLAISKGETVKGFVDNNREGGNNLSFEEVEAIINLNSRLTF